MCGKISAPALTRANLKAAIERAEKLEHTLCDDSRLILRAARVCLDGIPKTAVPYFTVGLRDGDSTDFDNIVNARRRYDVLSTQQGAYIETKVRYE